jgi:cysteine desulfurase/selenocysteine lyase
VTDEFNVSKDEIIFVRGCTEGINLIATCSERAILKESDKVLITRIAHHSNYLPWKMACNQTKARLKVPSLTASGKID